MLSFNNIIIDPRVGSPFVARLDFICLSLVELGMPNLFLGLLNFFGIIKIQVEVPRGTMTLVLKG
jgi:hypothetical protein